MENCINLKSLRLFKTQVSNLPDLGMMARLEELFLEQDCMTEIPENIGQCKNLLKIKIKPTRIPENIGNCRKLTELNLSSSEVEEIPPSIGNCKSLTTLHLNDTKIRNLPF